MRTVVIVIDDNSPDGTAKIAESVSSRLGGIEVVRRRGARGYAAATKDAMQIALGQGYEVIATVEMPINYVDRAYGDSKMNTRIMRESMLLVTRWGIALRTGLGLKHLPR